MTELMGYLILKPPRVCKLCSSCLPEAAPCYAEAIQDLQAVMMGYRSSQSEIGSLLSMHYHWLTAAKSGEIWVAMLRKGAPAAYMYTNGFGNPPGKAAALQPGQRHPHAAADMTMLRPPWTAPLSFHPGPAE